MSSSSSTLKVVVPLIRSGPRAVTLKSEPFSIRVGTPVTETGSRLQSGNRAGSVSRSQTSCTGASISACCVQQAISGDQLARARRQPRYPVLLELRRSGLQDLGRPLVAVAGEQVPADQQAASCIERPAQLAPLLARPLHLLRAVVGALGGSSGGLGPGGLTDRIVEAVGEALRLLRRRLGRLAPSGEGERHRPSRDRLDGLRDQAGPLADVESLGELRFGGADVAAVAQGGR